MKKYLLIAAVLFGAAFAVAEDWQDIVFGPFGGLNDRDSSAVIRSGQFSFLSNFTVSPDGRSIKKRSGYSVPFSLNPSTSPVGNMHLFWDQSGNDVMLFFIEQDIVSSVNGGAATVIYSTATNEAVWDCADYLGYAYCANSARDSLFKTNGVTVDRANSLSSTGTMVAALPTRLAMAGFSGTAASRIDFSGEADFTAWGTGSLGTSPTQITINAPGSRITHITYAFGRLLWFKEQSFGYIITGNQPAQSDWVIKTVSNSIGTLDNTSTMDPEGNLYFRGQDRRIYRFDGNQASEFSSEIQGTIRLTTATTTSPAYSTYFDNKLWFGVPYPGTLTGTVLIYDFLSGAWSTFDLSPTGFLVRNNQLYFGRTGQICLYGGSNGDNGSAVNAAFTTKLNFAGDPFRKMDLVNFSLMSNVTNSTSTVFVSGFVNNGGRAATYSVYTGTYTTNPGWTYTNRNISPTLANGARFTVIETSSSTPPIEIYAIRLGVRPRSWIVE